MIRLLRVAIVAVLALPTPGLAAVVRLEITARDQVLDGRAFGDGGAYEKITGRIVFAFDPDNAMNGRIVDLALAPRNADGLVEASANFMVLRPVDPGKRNVALLEVSNRGRKASLRYFNRAREGTVDPTTDAHFGDGLLLREGLTVIWVGWQADVPDRAGALRLEAPIATGADGAIEGLVRCDWTVDETTTTLGLGHRGHTPYPVADVASPNNVLTVRDGRLAPRRTVPRAAWWFTDAEGSASGTLTHITHAEGFEAGGIYELVYRARDPRVVGLGLAVVRDVMSYVKHDGTCPFPAELGIAFGVSQTGRFLRHFLYQGFNTDELGRPVFDGMLIHTAGAGRGSFNHRFAQPSRDAHRYSAFFYPTDLFPFATQPQRDPVTGVTDGLLEHAFRPAARRPKLMFTNTGYEYWGRAASLIHTTPDGAADIAPLDRERIYHFASAQHFLVPRPSDTDASKRAYRGNPVDFLVMLRALMVRLVEWVRDDLAPPPSRHPLRADGTLVDLATLKFPQIPGVDRPDVVHEAYRADYGPRWEEGIIDDQPPRLGPAFPSLVPQVDEIGNEQAGIRAAEVIVPLATYTSWHLRPDGEVTDFFGTYIPLPRTEAERSRTGDPRPSIESLYGTRQRYLRAVDIAVNVLVDRGLVLPEDAPRVRTAAADHWDALHAP